MQSSMALKQLIGVNFALLRRSLNPSAELLAKLRSVEVVKRHLVSIKQQPSLNEKNNALLDALLDVPDDLQETVMNDFISALRRSDQDHVANIFCQESDVVPMSDAHYNTIVQKRSSLCRYIKPNDGLVDHLMCSGVFSDTDRTAVLSKVRIDDMAEETLSILLRKSNSCFEKFVTALEETDQTHVAYLITGVGRPPMSNQHRELLLGKMDELCKYLDVENGLLHRLISRRVVSHVEAERIRSVADYNVMAEKLVTSLLRKHDDAFHDFVKALNYTGQKHVTYILTGEGDCRPLKDELRNMLLSRQRDQVVTIIDSKHSSFLSALMSKGVLTSYDEQRVTSVRPDTSENRNEIILNLVARKSQLAFFSFISALNDTDQTHVVVKLIGVEVVTKIKAHYDTEASNRNCVLPNIESQLLQHMLEMFECNGTVVSKLNKVLSQNGVVVSDIREGCIQVTFICKSLESLKSFQDLSRSGELEILLSEAFCPQFDDKGLKFFEVEVSDEEYERCEKMFDRCAPMTSGHREALESSAEWLVDKLTVRADLLDRLSLCTRRRRAIENAEAPKEQVRTLIDIVSRQPDSGFAQLLNALACTQQQEVAKYVSAKSPGTCAENATDDLEEESCAKVQADVKSNKLFSSNREGLLAHDITQMLTDVKRNDAIYFQTVPDTEKYYGNPRILRGRLSSREM